MMEFTTNQRAKYHCTARTSHRTWHEQTKGHWGETGEISEDVHLIKGSCISEKMQSARICNWSRDHVPVGSDMSSDQGAHDAPLCSDWWTVSYNSKTSTMWPHSALWCVMTCSHFIEYMKVITLLALKEVREKQAWSREFSNWLGWKFLTARTQSVYIGLVSNLVWMLMSIHPICVPNMVFQRQRTIAHEKC